MTRLTLVKTPLKDKPAPTMTEVPDSLLDRQPPKRFERETFNPYSGSWMTDSEWAGQ